MALESKIVAATIDKNENYLVAITEDKKLIVWNIAENEVKLLSQRLVNYRKLYNYDADDTPRELIKKPSCIGLDEGAEEKERETWVIVGDKFGDVYR